MAWKKIPYWDGLHLGGDPDWKDRDMRKTPYRTQNAGGDIEHALREHRDTGDTCITDFRLRTTASYARNYLTEGKRRLGVTGS